MIVPTVFKFVKTVKYLNRAGFPCYIDVLIRNTDKTRKYAIYGLAVDTI
jgi:hypothetical protein